MTGCLVVATILANSLAAWAAEDLDPSLSCQAQRGPTVTYEVAISVVVTPPYKAAKLQVWLPVPPSDGIQEVSDYRVTSYPIGATARIGAEPRFGNRFAYLEYDQPKGAQIIRQEYRVTVPELRWGVGDSAPAVARWPEVFADYLRSELTVTVDDGVKHRAQEIVPTPRDVVTDMRRVMDWIMENMRYDHTVCSLKASSVFALRQQCGHCSDYHGLGAALGRALGYPTRVTYGINPYPKNSPTHCKLEVFVPGRGWVSYDLSATQEQIAGIEADTRLSEAEREALQGAARARLHAGFRDNTWVRLTTGTDYVLPFDGPRVPLVRTAFVVADGEALPDPDPGNKQQREFAWMTVHEYRPDRVIRDPFEDRESLGQAPN